MRYKPQTKPQVVLERNAKHPSLVNMPATLVVSYTGRSPSIYLWRTVKPCPLCGLKRGHIHGGGHIIEDPRRNLGPRGAHCIYNVADGQRPGPDYFLVDADPDATAATIADARAKLAAGVKNGVYPAQRILTKARAELAAREGRSAWSRHKSPQAAQTRQNAPRATRTAEVEGELAPVCGYNRRLAVIAGRCGAEPHGRRAVKRLDRVDVVC